MQRFIRKENISRYRRLIALGEANPGRDEARQQMLIRLLAEEEAREERERRKIKREKIRRRPYGQPCPCYMGNLAHVGVGKLETVRGPPG